MKKHLTVIYFSACIFCLPLTSYSADSSLEFGLNYFYFDYKEDLVPPHKSTESGWLPGIYFSYDYKRKSSFYTKLYLSYAGGDITYDGSTQDGTPLIIADSRQRFLKLQWDIGYTFPLGKRASLIPFTGYGYRYWERGQNRVTATYTESQEDYSWSYIPVGLRLDYAVNDKWNVGAAFSANFMFNGKMTARDSQVIPGRNDPEFTLGNEVGCYAEIPVRYRISGEWSLVITPWYEYSAIGRSDNVSLTNRGTVIGYAYEPASRTHQYGVNAAVSYAF